MERGVSSSIEANTNIIGGNTKVFINIIIEPRKAKIIIRVRVIIK